MSCYFQSIGTLLNISTNIVRKNVCDFMINTLQDENSEYFELLNVWFENENDEGNGIERYIQSMQRGSTWGGGPELAATCLVYNKSIRITNLRKNQKYPIMNIEGSSNDLDILNISWSGNHYEPIAIITPDDEAFSYNFEEEIEDLGSKNPVIIAFGNDCFKILSELKNKYRIFKVPHYSSNISKEKLRDAFNEISKLL